MNLSNRKWWLILLIQLIRNVDRIHCNLMKGCSGKRHGTLRSAAAKEVRKTECGADGIDGQLVQGSPRRGFRFPVDEKPEKGQKRSTLPDLSGSLLFFDFIHFYSFDLNWLIDSLIHWLTDWLIDWLIHWLIHRLIHRLIDRLTFATSSFHPSTIIIWFDLTFFYLLII